MMLSTLLKSDTPYPVAEDACVQETERAWREADGNFQKVIPRYERLKLLVSLPANRTLSDLNATEDEQDQAFVDFPGVVQAFGTAKVQAQRTRAAYEVAHAAAKTARTQWYVARRQAHLAKLVEVIVTAVSDHVRDIHDVVNEAGLEGISLPVLDLPSVPLRVGTAQQAGIEMLQALVK